MDVAARRRLQYQSPVAFIGRVFRIVGSAKDDLGRGVKKRSGLLMDPISGRAQPALPGRPFDEAYPAFDPVAPREIDFEHAFHLLLPILRIERPFNHGARIARLREAWPKFSRNLGEAKTGVAGWNPVVPRPSHASDEDEATRPAPRPFPPAPATAPPLPRAPRAPRRSRG